MTKLVTFKTNGGVPFTVAAEHAAKFQSLLNDLEGRGYSIYGDQSGGYNYRNIAGTNKLSNHAHGAAVDVNWTDNARGTAGKIPPDVARELAAKYGMTWGGDWKNPDPMHFEIAHAGHEHVPPQTTAPGENKVDPITMLLSLFAKGGGTPTAAPASATTAAAAPASGSPSPFGFKIGAPDPMPQAPQMQAPNLLGQDPQRPIDLSRLRSVIASRQTFGMQG